MIYALFLAVIGTIAVLDPGTSHSAATAADAGELPPEALAALQEGRYLRASLILREYLAASADTTPSAILLAARAEAGWGDWERVQELLAGRAWLDRESSGLGWNLLGRSQLALGRWHDGSESIARYIALAVDEEPKDQGIALLRRADGLTAQGKYAEAIAAYDNAAKLLPQIEDWIAVFAASAAAGAGDTTAVATRLAGLDSALVNDWSWRTMARARQNAHDLPGAIAAAERAAGRLTGDSRRAAAWTYIAALHRERGDDTNARRAYIRAINAASGSSAAIEAARELSTLGNLSPDDQLVVGRVYLRHGNIQRGVAGLTAYIDAGRGTAAQREQLRYDIANAYFNAGQYRDAERALLAISTATDNRRVASDALYTTARAQYRDGRESVAHGTLDRIISEYPREAAAVRASWLLGDLNHDAGDLDRASKLYRQVIELGPDTDEANYAYMRLGGIAFAAGQYEEALAIFDEYRNVRNGNPRRDGSSSRGTTGSAYTRQQAAYWTAVTLGRLGRTAEARERLVEVRRIDPFSYYGGIAGELLGDNGWSSRLEPEPPLNEEFDAQVQRALSRVDLLREIGWEEAATFEMDRVRRHFARFDGALYSLAEALNARGFTGPGINLGRDIYRREGAWNLRLLRIVYPFPFRHIVMAEAEERDVDAFLAAALIRQESMFNPRAKSPAGAIGLMQVMPTTGRSLARTLGIRRFNADMLAQPELNIVFGMRYLADQLRTYGNRLDAVLAAYNAGPTRVERWKQFPEFDDTLLFAERIPFVETRDYVRIVQNNRRIYAALYGEDS